MVCDEQGKEYADNVERAVFYARGVLETVKKLRWVPEIIHCQGWMSSIVPLYIKTCYAEEPSFRDCRVIYTPSDEPLQNPLPENYPGILHFRNADISCMEGLPNTTDMSALELLGIKYADGVSMIKPDAKLDEFIQSMGKPCLPAQNPEDYSTAFPAFYDKIWSEGKEDEEDEDE
jgi:starch synthase